MEVKDKHILVGKIPVKEIAEKYGTPVYVYDEQEIRRNYRKFHEAFSSRYENFRTYYSIKVNFLPAIISILHSEGAGADCSSVFEIRMALELGIDKNEILYTSSYNSDEQLEYVIEHNIPINFDDIHIFDRFVSLDKASKFNNLISFRIDLGAGAGVDSKGISLTRSKFGILPQHASQAYRDAIEHGFKRLGIHAMIRSCVMEEGPNHFEKVTSRLLDIAGSIKRGFGVNLEMINVGGGFGIPYSEDTPEFDIQETAKRVTDTLKKEINGYGLENILLLAEPGRYLVGNAGYLVAQIHAIKRKNGKTYVGTDAGVNVFMRKSLYNSDHRICVDGKEGDRPFDIVDVCGQMCDNLDIIASDRHLPHSIDEGDICVILDAGAYGTVRASNWGTTPRPAEVLVNHDKHYLIRERETYEDFVRLFHIPDYLKKRYCKIKNEK